MGIWTFKSLDDLARSLRAAGLHNDVDRIVATARPCICLIRRPEPDDALAIGTSKMGGIPDLPPGFAWPARPPHPQAAKHAAAIKKNGAEMRAWLADWGRGPNDLNMPIQSPAELDKVTRQHNERAAVLFDPFPLAFLAQLNLAQLASEPGLDPDFPRSGLLSLFVDVTSDGQFPFPRVFWHDVDRARLERRSPPASLIAHCDSANNTDEGMLWANTTDAEVLYPASAFAVPDHWKRIVSLSSTEGKALWSWFEEPKHAFFMEAPADWPPGMSVNFGDTIGGWPANIQGASNHATPPISVPGVTPWRQLFSFGGEYNYGVRRLQESAMGDGQTYVLIQENDFKARRFDRAGYVYQST
jgi:Domain of unknown function (DUF1963)